MNFRSCHDNVLILIDRIKNYSVKSQNLIFKVEKVKGRYIYNIASQSQSNTQK